MAVAAFLVDRGGARETAASYPAGIHLPGGGVAVHVAAAEEGDRDADEFGKAPLAGISPQRPISSGIVAYRSPEHDRLRLAICGL